MQIEEARRRQSELASVIDDGVDELDLRQEVEFQGYTRTVLPLDGYVFWLPTTTICAHGALHHMQEMLQHEDETVGLASVTFTTREYITEFADCPVDTIYVACRGDFRYAFSRQQGFFQQAGLWHYQGSSIYPALSSQLIDNAATLDPSKVIVSNSLPVWLAFNGYTSPYVGGFSNSLTLYPSKLVPANLPPPYGAVHIEPSQTRALQGAPQVLQTADSYGNPVRVMTQLKADRVRLTLYGLQDDAAEEFYGALLEYIGAQGAMGLMSMPTLQDGKRDQVELQTIAMQKFLDMDVSYNSYYAKAVAIQTIKSASTTFNFNP